MSDDGALYFTAIEHDAIERLRPGGALELVTRDPRIKWPDSIAIWRGPQHDLLFFTTSQIHLTWPFNGTDVREEPFGLFVVALPRA